MYNSYMFNDKLHIFTYKNTIYQSKLKLILLAIIGQVRFSDKTFSSTNRFRACTVHHTGAELSWLTWIIDTNCLRTRFPGNISLKPLFGVFGCFRWIFTHISSSLGEKFRFKKSDKIVDTVTLRWKFVWKVSVL
jgi:hypothetical protein